MPLLRKNLQQGFGGGSLTDSRSPAAESCLPPFCQLEME